jgi:hypothetical protein
MDPVEELLRDSARISQVGSTRVGGRIIADLEGDNKEAKATYKIEIRFGPDRSNLETKPSAGALLIWESGKKLHGGGDDQMFWCGYSDCDKPISSSNFALYHVVCPWCKRTNFTDENTKAGHIQHLQDERRASPGIEKLPCVADSRFFRLPPSKLAQLLVKTFRSLGSDADIYLKYHPKEIRLDKTELAKASTLNKLYTARMAKKPLVYPLKNILKDTAAGADVYQRFLAMLRA